MHSDRQHAVLSASGAHRWLACPPSALLEAKEPDQSSEHAKEGTFAHELAEVELRKALGERARRPAGYKDSPYYSQSMEEHIAAYVSQVMERVAAHGEDVQVLLEQRLDFSRWVPGGFGTGDVVIISPGKVEVIDLKYGTGVPVSAIGNPQLRLYGLGAYDAYDALYGIDRVVVTIVQPRLDSITTEELTADELLRWAEEEVVPRAALAAKGEGSFQAGGHCGFCRVRHTCRARAEWNLEIAKYDFRPPDMLTPEEISDILRRESEFVRWLKDVSDWALDRAVNQGYRFPGYKLVEGRSNRRYTDEEAVLDVLTLEYDADEVAPRKVLGITALEKLLGKATFQEMLGEYIEKPPGKPVLVPESDKRPELQTAASAQEDFADVETA